MSFHEAKAFEIQTPDGGVLRGLQYPSLDAPETATTALCIHGFSSDADSMRWLARALNRTGLNAVVPDLRGHGLSDSARGRGLRTKRLSEDTAEICQQLGLKKIIVVTQSYGGWIGLGLLEKNISGLEIEALYAFAPNWFVESRPWSEIKEWAPRSARILWRLGRLNGFLSPRKPARLDYDRYAGRPDFHIPRMQEEVRSMSWPRFAPRFIAMQRLRHRRCPDWASLGSLPVTLVLAREDRLVENAELEKVADRTGWPLTWIECGHLGVATEKKHADAMADIIANDLS